MLNIIDEFSRECLAIKVAKRLSSEDVINVLADLFIKRRILKPVLGDYSPPRVQTNLDGLGSELVLFFVLKYFPQCLIVRHLSFPKAAPF